MEWKIKEIKGFQYRHMTYHDITLYKEGVEVKVTWLGDHIKFNKDVDIVRLSLNRLRDVLTGSKSSKKTKIHSLETEVADLKKTIIFKDQIQNDLNEIIRNKNETIRIKDEAFGILKTQSKDDDVLSFSSRIVRPEFPVYSKLSNERLKFEIELLKKDIAKLEKPSFLCRLFGCK